MTEVETDSDDWKAVVSRTGRRFYLFVPAIIISWLMVEAVAPQVPRAPWLAQTGLFLVCLDFYLAAAAKVCDEFAEENVIWLAVSRAGCFVGPMMVLILLSLVSLASALVVVYQDNVWLSALAVTAAAVLDLYVLARAWPMWGVPYHFTGKLVWSPSVRGSGWSGPGLGLAWRLTCERGLLNCYSLRFMALLIAVTACVVVLRYYLSLNGLSDILLYVFGLPLLSVFAVDGTGEMLGTTQIDLEQYE